MGDELEAKAMQGLEEAEGNDVINAALVKIAVLIQDASHQLTLLDVNLARNEVTEDDFLHQRTEILTSLVRKVREVCE